MISVTALRKAMRDISAKKGDFTLFGVFKRESGLGKWDLVVAAPWLKANEFKGLSCLVRLLTASLGKRALLDTHHSLS